METKTIRIDTECEDILRKYSEGSLSDCIRAMEARISQVTVNNVSGITKEEFKQEMDRLRDGIKTVHAEYMKYLSSGQGAVKVPSTEAYGFTRASALKSELKPELKEG